MDLFAKCASDAGYFGQYRLADDEFFTKPVLDSFPGPHMDFQGRPQIMWSVNNYLGLADEESIRQRAAETIQTHSVSAPMGSRMMTGTTSTHKQFEAELAAFAQKESAILFNYGYLGVLGTIASLAGPDDVIVMDKLAHACIVDSAFLAPANFRVFRHNDMDSLEMTLKRVNRDRKGGVMVLTEGTYGMTGDLAPMDTICALKDRYEARLFVDDAHGFGVMGANGRGIGEYFGVQDQIDLYFGTFAKAFASIGGMTAGPRQVVDWIRYNARTQVFAKSLPMVYVRSLQRTLELVQDGQERRARMWAVSNALKTGLRELGYYVGPGAAPICPVFVTTPEDVMEETAKRMMTYLRERGIFVTAVAYPVIPRGFLMFRMIPTAAHSEDDVAETIRIFGEMRNEMALDVELNEEQVRRIKHLFAV